MKNQLYPKEFLNQTVEVHHFRFTVRSRVIYLSLLFLLFSALLSLPFIYVGVYTSSRGIIKPITERISLRINQQGQVVFSQLQPHLRVKKGDTLLRLAHPLLDERSALLSNQLKEHHNFIEDLKVMSLQKKSPKLLTARYQKEWLLFQEGKAELSLKKRKATADYTRDKQLFQQGVIARNEFEESQLTHELATTAFTQYKQRYATQWETALHENEHEQKQLLSREKELKQSQAQFILTAPSDGTLLISEGIPVGSWINAGQIIGTISPDGDLCVEVYVPPQKIGQIYPKAPVKFSIDAYNYHQWGTATGEVIKIGDDIELIDNQAVFKVLCRLDQAHLNLPSGIKGSLTKGLTLTALFYQARRSLFQLLYDDVNDWINPNQSNSIQNDLFP